MPLHTLTVGTSTFAHFANFNLKSTLTAYLRKQKIPYKTFPGFVQFQNVTIFFDTQNEYITIRSATNSEISMCTPYCIPARILAKVKQFKTSLSVMSKKIEYTTSQPLILSVLSKKAS